MDRSYRVLLAWSLLASAAGAAGAQQSPEGLFASRVIEYAPGEGNEYFPDPALALGGPRGMPDGSLHVVTLGVTGELVLGFEPGQGLTDGDGADLIVFENAFGSAFAVFAELVRVGVSTNGLDYAFFPTRCDVPGPVGPYATIDPSLVNGFAGVGPVVANIGPPEEGGNDVDPFDPAAAGGDAFDLADLQADPLVQAGCVSLDRIYYVRLVDCLGDGSEQDSLGNPVYDPAGNMFPPWSMPVSADIDAVSIIHGLCAGEPGDTNRDGLVDYVDLGVLASNYGTTSGMTWEDGDFTADGAVDYVDLGVLASHYGQGAAGRGAVCEPASTSLCLIGAVVVLCRRSRRRCRHGRFRTGGRSAW